MTPIITVESLSHVYSRGTPFENTAIDDISLEIARGEFLGFIGHTGSGKSTLIQHLNGLLVPTGGRILYEGEDIHATKEATRDVRFKVGLVFQYPEYQLFEETVYRDIAFGPRNMKLTESEIHERVHEAAAFAGVSEELLEKSPLDLSGGQKRRAAIAGVIAMRPEVLILDEPTAGLDPGGREDILGNICRYHESTGSTVILVSHSMDDIARIARRIVVFSRGRLAMEGAPAEIFRRGSELRKMGLSVPEVTKIANRLRELGLPVPDSVYTMDELKSTLLHIEREGRKNA